MQIILAILAILASLVFQLGLFAVDSEHEPSAADEDSRKDVIILWGESGKITIIDAVRGAIFASLSGDEAMRVVKELPDKMRVLLCLPASAEAEAHNLRVQVVTANPTIRSIKLFTIPATAAGQDKK